MRTTLRRDLFAHNAWGNAKLLDLCEGLDDAALDETVPMGYGSLRATMHHLWAAERLWLDRWQFRPWAPLDESNPRWSVAELRQRLAEVHAERERFLDELGPHGEDKPIAYKNTRGEAFEHPLSDLMLHVSNHGIHHRAQALNMLKRHGRTALGLDYLFFRIERPTVELPADTVAAFQRRNFLIAVEPGVPATLDPQTIARYFAYGDWGTRLLFDLAAGLEPEALDRAFGMGPGSLRKTLSHIRDAEAWWMRNWTEGPSAFEPQPAESSLGDVRRAFDDVAARRNEMLQSQSAEDLERPVETLVAGDRRLRFRLGESMLQLCGHGTHHRAQAVNMLRQLGVQPPMLDYVMWLRTAPMSQGAEKRP